MTYATIDLLVRPYDDDNLNVDFKEMTMQSSKCTMTA